MSKLPQIRVVIDDEPQSGAWNMAVDEALLESAIERQWATLRLYRWREPTVSLGYFQSERELLESKRFAGLPAVRRLTGGGTLIHDCELTYSLTLPSTQALIGRPMELYSLVHSAFISVFRRSGVDLQLRGHTFRQAVEPLLCFSREDEHDLVLHGRKVLGSAQRRRRGAILQHGGLIIAASRVTPELLGIEDLSSSKVDGSVESDLVGELVSRLAVVQATTTLAAEEVSTAKLLESGQYSSLSRLSNSAVSRLQME